MSLSDEQSLVNKLVSLGLPAKGVFDGDTYRDQRMEKVRVYCREVPEVVYRIEQGKIITMAMAFRRAYEEEL